MFQVYLFKYSSVKCKMIFYSCDLLPIGPFHLANKPTPIFKYFFNRLINQSDTIHFQWTKKTPTHMSISFIPFYLHSCGGQWKKKLSLWWSHQTTSEIIINVEKCHSSFFCVILFSNETFDSWKLLATLMWLKAKRLKAEIGTGSNWTTKKHFLIQCAKVWNMDSAGKYV